MSRSIRSIAPALSLVLLLSAGAAHALPRPQVVPSQPAGLLDAAWDWLVELFAPLSGQDAAGESRDKAGWELDPNGLQFISTPGTTQTLTVQSDRCTTDPSSCR